MSFLNKFLHKNKRASGVPADQQKDQAAATNTAAPSEPSAPASKDSSATSKPQPSAPTDMASLSKAKQFLELVKSRRTIYALGKKQVLPDSEIVDIIKSAVKESPSSFNAQSSRVVILLGAEHEKYWNDTVLEELRKIVPDDEKFEQGKARILGFKAAYGTALFFEDGETIEQFQKNVASYADRFPEWSTHSTGMAQINTWTALEIAGYGANLQHYGNLTGPSIIKKLGLSEKYKLHAELVFGSPEGPAGDKTYINDDDRFKVLGASS